jgi:prefoldin subunit 5
MRLELLKLILKDFKGIRYFELDADGKDIHVFGANGSGKTSLADGIHWLLFGKDSINRADFGIKTLDGEGVVIPKINHEVEGIFNIDGSMITLKKVYREDYTNKKGSSTETFSGHLTDYFINGVPNSKGDYDRYIAKFADEKTFKILTNPNFFNDNKMMEIKGVPGWKVRRNILVDICGDISDEDIIATNKELADLPAILQGRSIEDHRKIIDARRGKINEEIKKIPDRIDEVSRSLPDVSTIDKELLEAEVFSLEQSKQAKEQEISRILSGGEIAEQQRLLRESESRLLDISTNYRSQTSDIIFSKKKNLQELQLKLSSIDGNVLSIEETIKSLNSEIQTINAAKSEVLKEWRAASATVFEICLEETCPTCKQSLPADQLESAREKALSQFNLNKSKKVESLFNRGTKMKSDIESKEKQITDNNASIAKLTSDKKALQLSIDSLQAEIDGMGEIADITTDAEYLAELAVKEGIQAKITNFKTIMQDLVDNLNRDIDTIKNNINLKQSDLIKLSQLDGYTKRIEELSNQEKELGKEFLKLDRELFLTEQFIRAKVNLLEDKINCKFKYAKFKLFDVQVNGALNETCETLGKDNVPYGSGLNQAAKTNVGLDIINTLSEYYKFSPMIFVDNRESVSDLIETNAQVISLIVSKPDKVLRIEREVSINA